MLMLGGGPHGVGPGQGTDDSELTIALMNGLIDSGKQGDMNIDCIAKRYVEWFKSDPFEIGRLTSKSLSNLS